MKLLHFPIIFCLASLNIVAQQAQMFSKVNIEIDGSTDMKIIQDDTLPSEKYDLSINAKTGESENSVAIKDGVLNIVCAKKSEKLGLIFVLKVPKGVQELNIQAKKAKVLIAGCNSAVKIKMYKMDLTIEGVLKSLYVNAQGLRARLDNMNYDVHLDVARMSLSCAVTECVKQNIVINSNMCEVNIGVAETVRIKYSKNGWMRVNSDFQSVDDANLVIDINTKIGKLNITKKEKV